MNQQLAEGLHTADHLICIWLARDILELNGQYRYCARKIQTRGMSGAYLNLWLYVMGQIVYDLEKCYVVLFLILEELNLLGFWPQIDIW